MQKNSLFFMLVLLIGILLSESILAEECDLSNHFVDEATGECICDFGRGYFVNYLFWENS